MLKQLIFLFIATIFAIYFIHEVALFLHYVNHSYHYLSRELMPVFAPRTLGRFIRHTIALISIPLFMGLIPAGFYWVFNRHQMPFLYPLIWIFWMILLTTVALHI